MEEDEISDSRFVLEENGLILSKSNKNEELSHEVDQIISGDIDQSSSPADPISINNSDSLNNSQMMILNRSSTKSSQKADKNKDNRCKEESEHDTISLSNDSELSFSDQKVSTNQMQDNKNFQSSILNCPVSSNSSIIKGQKRRLDRGISKIGNTIIKSINNKPLIGKNINCDMDDPESTITINIDDTAEGIIFEEHEPCFDNEMKSLQEVSNWDETSFRSKNNLKAKKAPAGAVSKLTKNSTLIDLEKIKAGNEANTPIMIDQITVMVDETDNVKVSCPIIVAKDINPFSE